MYDVHSLVAVVLKVYLYPDGELPPATSGQVERTLAEMTVSLL